MIPKNGFLFIELMIGLTLSLLLMVISAHYIIEVKNIQQGARLRIEALSLARTLVEKLKVAPYSVSVDSSNNKNFTVSIMRKSSIFHNSYSDSAHKVTVPLSLVSVEWVIHDCKNTVQLYAFDQTEGIHNAL